MFSQLEDGRWVWTTFHSYQWDLDYSKPAVFKAMAGEMLYIANLGTEFLRMDAVAFIWKRLGTVCENLPEAHTLIRAFNAVCRIAAPSLLFKSEAIVHPDDVVRYISPAECQISYNPLQMALLWNTLATREGLSATASVITSAALIMIAVFGAFAFARILLMQFVGFGLAVAVLLDATIIRMVLVPSLMQIAGAWNWWPGYKPPKSGVSS